MEELQSLDCVKLHSDFKLSNVNGKIFVHITYIIGLWRTQELVILCIQIVAKLILWQLLRIVLTQIGDQRATMPLRLLDWTRLQWEAVTQGAEQVEGIQRIAMANTQLEITILHKWALNTKRTQPLEMKRRDTELEQESRKWERAPARSTTRLLKTSLNDCTRRT